MYLYSRLVDVRGNERRALGLAVETANYVNGKTGGGLALWRVGFGGPAGSLAWSSWHESLADFDSGAELMDDPGLNDLVDRGESIFTNPRDHWRELIHGNPADRSLSPGAVATVTTASMKGGRYEDAVAWGVEIAELVEEISDARIEFLMDATGRVGGVTWIGISADAATSDRATAALNGNDKYLSHMRDVGELFIQGSGEQRIYRRVV